MNHNPVYIYEADSTDFSTTGICGDLLPKEAYFEEEKNGLSEVTMTLAYDKWGKWKEVQVGRYIKVAVPVRVPPQIVDGDYATTVTRYEPVTTRVPVYSNPLGTTMIDAIDQSVQSIFGKSFDEATGNNVSAAAKITKQGVRGIVATYRVQGYIPKTSLRRIDEVAIAPASYGMESITELVTRSSEQFFKIVEVVQGDDEIKVTAEHIFYELSTNYTSYHPAENYEVSGSTCVNQILANLYSPETRFQISSSSSATQKGLDFDRKSVVEALLDPKKGACALYNMVLLRDNWSIYCLPEADVGFDRGFVVEYGKNMVSVERTENCEKLITRVIPWGKDASGNIKYPTNRNVDSQYIGDYATISVELLDTGIQIGKNGCTAANFDSLVRAEAQKRFDDDKIDLPEVQMKVDFLSLGDTEEYIQFRNLDKVYLYDKITVKDTLRGYEYNAEVVAVKHNILTGQLEEVTLGSIVNGDGVRKIAVWQVPTISGENIRLKSIQLGALADGSVGTDELLNGAVTSAKIANLAVGNAQIDNASITNAKISNAGIEYAKIKELNAESAFFGQSVFQEAVGEKLYVPRLLFDTAQGRQMVVKDIVVGASNGKYYHLDITETDNGIQMTPTEYTVSASEVAQGHTTDGQPIIGTTATVADLATTNLYAIDALIDRITAKRINVDELWARQAFINKLNVQDLTSNTYIHAAIEGLEGDISDVQQTADGVNVEVGKIKDGTTAVKALDNTRVSITASGVSIKTGGTFSVASGNFSLDSSGNVTVKGNVQASSGSIGGWTIGTNDLHAGSGSSYVSLSTSGDYAMWAGASSSGSAPFRVKKDGTVYSSKFVIVNEQGGESTIDLRNYALWKLNYATIKNLKVENNTLTIETTKETINFSKPSSSVTLTGVWDGGNYTVTATGAGITTKTITSSVTYGWSGDTVTVTNGAGTDLLKTTVTINQGSWGSDHKMTVAARRGVTNIVTATVDATSQYNAGASSVTVSGSWNGKTYTATASNGAKATTTTGDISEEAAQGYNSTTHNFTVYAYYTTGDGTHQTKNITVDGARAYNAGVAAGEAEFTKHDSTVYTVANSGYANINLGYWQGSTSPPSGFHSVGTGFYKISTAASTWYTKN